MPSKQFIHYGDALARVPHDVPQQTVDLVFTDPIYDKYEQYAWLETLLQTVVKPTGTVLAFVNSKHLANVLRTLKDAPTGVLSVVQQTNGGLSGKTIAKSYHLVWLGAQPHSFVPDGYISNTWSKANEHNHKWTKNPHYVGLILSKFTKPDDLVLDPFCGGGTIPAMCKALGRNCIAYDVSHDAVSNARERVATMQEQVISLEPTQEQTPLF